MMRTHTAAPSSFDWGPARVGVLQTKIAAGGGWGEGEGGIGL